METKRTLLVIGILLAMGSLCLGQKKGPKDRLVIRNARVDQSFASTPLNQIIMLPFANELDYSDGSMILTDNFIAAMRQKHPEITIIGPQEAKQIIQEQKLGTEYRTFLGNYNNTGVATTPFLQAIARARPVDAIFLGKILGFGVMKQYSSFGGISWSKDKAVVGMEVTLLRTKDGRELWWGTHAIQGDKNENVRDLAKTVGDVFGAYFGRLPY